MPGTASTMYAQLGLELDLSRIDLRQEASSWQLLEAGTEVAKKSNLFPRQEFRPDAEAEKQADSGKEQEETEPETIDFQDFQKLELRVGTVTESGPHPKADRLLRLKVDIGEAEPRQIVAGLAGDYAPEDLLGRQVVVVSNLKPRKLRGALSQGMVLAVHHKDGLGLIQPSLEVDPGSRVS
jgi:methionyl-tRNA synthetase